MTIMHAINFLYFVLLYSKGHGHSAQEVANLIQDLLICMEMLLAAISFFNAFPVQELIAHPFQIFPSLFQMKSEIKENVESMLVLTSPLTVMLHGKNVITGNSKFGTTQNPFFNLTLNPLHLGFSKNKYQSDDSVCGDHNSKDDTIMNSEQGKNYNYKLPYIHKVLFSCL